MAKKSRKNIYFQTKRQSSNGELKKFAAVFAACVIGIAGISCLAILSKYDFDVKSAVGGNSETETSVAETTTEPVTASAQGTVLFWCADSSAENLRFLWLCRFGVPENEVTLYSLDPKAVVMSNGVSRTFEGCYSASGETGLIKAVEEFAGVKIDRYIGSTDSTFKTMINYFGGVEINVPEQTEYRSGEFNLMLIKGRQNIKGDTMFRYMRYLATLGSEGRTRQSEVLMQILKNILSSKNLEKMGKIYSKLSNTLKTDITIVDFSQNEQALAILTEKGILAGNIANSIEDFSEE
ncbi:MAG: LCP family protein [Clostridia bacterium]|nr:LCP family protein [Clostridia bacterium]